jgi:hypothetical protein
MTINAAEFERKLATYVEDGVVTATEGELIASDLVGAYDTEEKGSLCVVLNNFLGRIYQEDMYIDERAFEIIRSFYSYTPKYVDRLKCRLENQGLARRLVKVVLFENFADNLWDNLDFELSHNDLRAGLVLYLADLADQRKSGPVQAIEVSEVVYWQMASALDGFADLMEGTVVANQSP